MPKTKLPKDETYEHEVEETVAVEATEDDEKEEALPITVEEQQALAAQAAQEWEKGWNYLKPRWDEWALRLRLYNNQKRDKESVGDTTLFDIFQTVLADLYSDKLIATFNPREKGDEEVAENLTITAEYDHTLMEKDIVDYEWDWEAMFYGRGLLCMMDFDREEMCPVPEVWYVLTVVRDPEAKSVNGDKRGRGRARFLYRETRMTKNEMEEAGVYFNLGQIKADSTNTKSPLDEMMRIQADAGGLGDVSKYDSSTVRVREGFTTHNGNLVFVAFINDMSTVVRYKVLGKASQKMPMVDRVLFPIPNSWDSVSIPDLVEDKQRGKAVALNLSLKTMKAGLLPMYIYDKTKFDDRTDFNFEFNKFIGSKGDPNGAVAIMPRDHVKSDVSFIMDTLDQSAQRATATPDVKRGGRPGQQGTATRDALVSKGSDKRYSLAAAIFGWSERRFWQMWYAMYKDHFKAGIDEKTVRITGTLGAQIRPFTRESIVTSEIDPDIAIESKEVSEARLVSEAALFRDYLAQAAASPDTNMRFGLRHYGKLIGIKTDIINFLFPPTIEELRAEDENKALQGGKKVTVLPTDDHYTHMQYHNKLEETPEKVAHINAHKRALFLAQTRGENAPMNAMAMPSAELPVPQQNKPGFRTLPM
jgi:hypothetical protein